MALTLEVILTMALTGNQCPDRWLMQILALNLNLNLTLTRTLARTLALNLNLNLTQAQALTLARTRSQYPGAQTRTTRTACPWR